MSDIEYTKSFILPLCNIASLTNQRVYAADENIDVTKPHIVLVYTDKLDVQSINAEHVIGYYQQQLEEEDIVGEALIVELPTEYIEDYNLFRRGLYSKMSDKAKKTIVQYWNGYGKAGQDYVNTFIQKVFDKDKELRKQTREVFNIKKDDNEWEAIEAPQNEIIKLKR